MKSTSKIICMGFAIIMILMTGCSSTSQITDLLQKNDYDKAVAEYNALNEPEKAIANSFTTKVEQIYTDYKEKKIDYTTAKADINSLSKTKNTDIENKCKDTMEKIEKLNNSRIAFETAIQFEEEKNYKDAIKQYSLVIEDDENYKNAQDKIKSCTNALRNDVILSAEKTAKNNDYESALKILNEALEALPNDSKLIQKIKVYTESYTKNIIEETDALIKDKKLDEAEKLLNNALITVPNNQTITKKLEEIENLRPVDLVSVHIIDSKNYSYHDDGYVDSFGNTYTGYHFFEEVDSGANVLFNLNQEYTTFSGTIAASEETAAEDVFFIQITCDGKNTYEKHNITKVTEPFDFSVNVKGCKKLEIRFGCDKKETFFGYRIGIVNAVLEKV